MDNKKKLTEGVFVDYEYDQETIRNRKLLYPILRAARNTEGYKGMCKLERDVLTLKGKRYTVRNISELPSELSGFYVSSKSNEDTYAWGIKPIQQLSPKSVQAEQHHLQY